MAAAFSKSKIGLYIDYLPLTMRKVTRDLETQDSFVCGGGKYIFTSESSSETSLWLPE
jgi:hypothetical protein